MTLYKDIYDMRWNPTLRKQVIIACHNTAVDIKNEAITTPFHDDRMAWSRSIMGTPSDLLIDFMLDRMTENTTLQAAAPSGPWLDSDVQFVVNSNVNLAIGH